MSPPDLTRVHPVVLARLRRVQARLPDPPRATPAEAVTLERWSIGQDRWGLLRIDGAVVAPDGFAFTFRVTPLAVDLTHLTVWTCHGWMRLGAPAGQPWSEAAFTALEELEHWCDALREGLRHG